MEDSSTAPPSKMLLEFYRMKLKEWRDRHARLELEVADAKRAVVSNARREEEALKVLSDTTALLDSLSELQLCLYKEREQVLRLTADNDRLRVEKADDKRKIQFLLYQCEMKETQLNPPEMRKRTSPRKKTRVRFQDVRDFNRRLEDFHDTEPNILRLKVKALEAELKEQTEHLRDEVTVLTNDLELRKSEWEVERKLLVQQVSCLNCRLKNAQLRQFDEISDILRSIERDRDREIKLVEDNERLKRSLDICKEILGEDFPENGAKPPRKKQIQLDNLKSQLYQKDHILRGYEAQVAEFERKIIELKEELQNEKEYFMNLRQKWVKKEELLMRKLEEEKKRRLSEGEGFRNDIKLLRSKLQSIERQIKQEKLKKKEHT